MKRFLRMTAAVGMALSLSAPLALAQQQPPGQHDQHAAGAQRPASPAAGHVAPQHAAGPAGAGHMAGAQHAAPEAARPAGPVSGFEGGRPGNPVSGFEGGRPGGVAPGYDGHQGGPGPQARNSHSWRSGERYTGSREVVTNWSEYHVQRPPSGYEYVRDGNQLVLIAVASGVIASVLANSGY